MSRAQADSMLLSVVIPMSVLMLSGPPPCVLHYRSPTTPRRPLVGRICHPPTMSPKSVGATTLPWPHSVSLLLPAIVLSGLGSPQDVGADVADEAWPRLWLQVWALQCLSFPWQVMCPGPKGQLLLWSQHKPNEEKQQQKSKPTHVRGEQCGHGLPPTGRKPPQQESQTSRGQQERLTAPTPPRMCPPAFVWRQKDPKILKSNAS